MQEEQKKKRTRSEGDKPIEGVIEATLRKVTAREKSERRLDSFATLCEGGMTCAAVTILNGELLVTTNTIHSNCQRDHRKQIGLVFLQSLLNYFKQVRISQKSDKAIELKLLNYIYCAAWQSENKKNVQSNPKINEAILSKIINYLLENNVSSWLREDITFFTQFLHEDDRNIFFADPDKRNKKRIESISNTLTDIRLVFSFISSYVRHLKKVVHMLIHSNHINNFKILAIGKPDEHAEIRLLGYLLDEGVLQRITQTKIDEKYYIGVSKLCCCHCAKVFEMINSVIRFYAPKNELNLALPNSKSISSENISDEIQQLVDDLDQDDIEVIRTAGTHGLIVKNWKSPSYADGLSYINKGGNDGDLSGYMWDAGTEHWSVVELDESMCSLELRDKIKSEFALGFKALTAILEKRKKTTKEPANKAASDDDRLSLFISQHFRLSVSMWPEMSSSSEEEAALLKAYLLLPNKLDQDLLEEYDHQDIDALLSPENIVKLSKSENPNNVIVKPLSALQDFVHRDMTHVKLLSEHFDEIRLNTSHYKPNQVIVLPCQMARHFFVVALMYTCKAFIPWYIHSVNQPLKDEGPPDNLSKLMEVSYGDDDVIKWLNQALTNICGPDKNLHIIRLNQQTAITNLCGGITVQNALDLISGKVNLLAPNPEEMFTIQDPSEAIAIVHRQRQLLKPDDVESSQYTAFH